MVLGGLTHDYSEKPCVGDVISLTCTLPGALLEWDVPDPTRDLTLDSLTELPFQRDQYTVTFIMFNSTSSMITSSLSFPAVDGITIGCLPIGQPQFREELTILTASEVMQSKFLHSIILFHVYCTATTPPNGFSDSILSSSANEVNVTVGWVPPTDTDDLIYTVTVSPPAQLSATVLTSTSATVTAQYNVDYAVNVVATNCAGNSTTAEYNFMIGKLTVLNTHTVTFLIPQAAVLC